MRKKTKHTLKKSLAILLAAVMVLTCLPATAMAENTKVEYKITVNLYLDDVKTNIEDIHDTADVLYISKDNSEYIALSQEDTGIYTATVDTGNQAYYLFHKIEDGTYHKLLERQITVYYENVTEDVRYYSVEYDTDGGSFEDGDDVKKEIYLSKRTVAATEQIPQKKGAIFIGWKDLSLADSELITSGGTVTSSLAKKTVLTAQWENVTNVYVNVTIDHRGGYGYDRLGSKSEVDFELVRRQGTDAFIETGDKVHLSASDCDGYTYTPVYETGTDGDDADVLISKFEATEPTFADLELGYEYDIADVSKSGYSASRTIEQNEDGEWIINIDFVFDPNNFDLQFSVKMDRGLNVEMYPEAVIVKMEFWNESTNSWDIITQQEGSKPGIRVNIDPQTGVGKPGESYYPVWKFDSEGNSYGNRFIITAFVYPGNVIVPAEKSVGDDGAVTCSDGIYTATFGNIDDGKLFGAGLNGAWYDGSSEMQVGTLETVLTANLHSITFEPNGGELSNELESNNNTIDEAYWIPQLSDYIPEREGGYVFDGWYLDEELTEEAVSGAFIHKLITADEEGISLYAKWKEPLAISGTVYIEGTYLQDGNIVNVHDVDKAKEVDVVLQEVTADGVKDMDDWLVEIDDYNELGQAEFFFEELPDNGTTYRIKASVINYNCEYDNNGDDNYTSDEGIGVFNSDNEAVINVKASFSPESYDQEIKIDVSAIGKNFRPKKALTEVFYRNYGSADEYNIISQHTVDPFGVEINIDTEDGMGVGAESVWLKHTLSGLIESGDIWYEYKAVLSKLYGDIEGAFDADGTNPEKEGLPYTVEYSDPQRWSPAENAATGALAAVLKPKEYTIVLDGNASGDVVEGLGTITHIWSHDTVIDAVPSRDGYVFSGWTCETAGAYDSDKNAVNAAVCEDVVLKAQWYKRIDISSLNSKAELNETSFVYDGNKKMPEVSVDGLVKDIDYTVSYERNINVGEGKVVVKGIGDYTGTIVKTFAITPADIKGVTAQGYEGEYDGNDYSITLEGIPSGAVATYSLEENGEYTTEKPTQKSVGELKIYYKVVKNNYNDVSGFATVKITPADASDCKVELSYAKKNYTGSYITAPKVVAVTNAAGEELINGTDYTVPTISKKKSVGRYKVTVTFKGNYAGKASAYYTIVPKAPTSATAKLRTVSGGYDDVKFSWKKATGATGYYVYYKKASAKGYTYAKRTTSLSYTKKNLTDGTKYYFKVVPYYKSGDTRYKSLGYKTASVYTLKKVSTPKLSRSGTKVKVRWTNINGETGYQISRSSKKSGTYIVSTYKTTKGTYKKVSATKGKKYYYKVRAYKVVDGKRVYGPWSSVKSYRR